jgi:hypothetical protein
MFPGGGAKKGRLLISIGFDSKTKIGNLEEAQKRSTAFPLKKKKKKK